MSILLRRFITAASCLFVLLTLAIVGCSSRTPDSEASPNAGDATSGAPDETTSEKVAAPLPTDPSDAVAAIEAVTTKMRRDGNGLIIEVDFRGTEVTDAALEPLSQLPRLRSVLLGGTTISDDSLKPIG
ncbi:MAG: hypothetical protein ACF787_13545, partial [Rhodopirellula sp. JB053]